ncbi:hypothetical protein [Demequina sp. SO4-18]|uniref:hypothetical protein n=1 Tax=Demequina sp. SO4-18 TaxID=3401026 RepID=UPI003B5B21BD
MALQATPAVAREYAAAQRREIETTTERMSRLWNRVGDDFSSGFERVAPQMIATMNGAQLRAAERAQSYIPDVLEATGQSRANRPRFEIEPRQWVGTAGDGRPTETLAYGAVTTAKDSISSGATVREAQRSGGQFLALAMQTLVADTARGAESASTYARPVSGYIRQIQGETCGRCIILAGKFYRKNAGFQRHPRCDCVHIPAAENIAGDLTTNPNAYLDSLDEKGLQKALGSKANARAYREFGADSTQLVNAYRRSGGIKTAQQYGRTIRYTTEGTTVRGVAYSQMSRVRALSATARRGGRYREVVAPRLMPESIFSLNLSQERTEQMLRDFGWLGYTPRTF